MDSVKPEPFYRDVFLTNDTVLALFYIFVFFSICANLRIIYIVFRTRRRRQPSANYIVLQLSVITIGYLVMTVLEKADTLINSQGPIQCRLLGFFETTLLSGFSANMIAVVYKLANGLQSTCQNRLETKMLIIFVCILPLFEGVLEAFKRFSIEEQEFISKPQTTLYANCTLVSILGSDTATLLIEISRFVIFHLMVTFYMAFVFFKIRLRLIFIYEISHTRNETLTDTIRSLRFTLVHLATFILVWLPIGFFNFALRLVSYSNQYLEDSQQGWLTETIIDKNSFVRKFTSSSTLVLFAINPIINLLLLDLNQNMKICACNTKGFSLSADNTPSPSYENEGNKIIRYFENEGESFEYTTGGLDSSEISTSDMEPTPAKFVSVLAMVHAQPDNDTKIETIV